MSCSMHEANCAHCRDADQKRIAELTAEVKSAYSDGFEAGSGKLNTLRDRAAALETALRDHASYFEKCGCVRVGDTVTCSLRAALDAHAAPVETKVPTKTVARFVETQLEGGGTYTEMVRDEVPTDPLVKLSEVEAALTYVGIVPDDGDGYHEAVLAKLRGAR